jgi:hypothetical protein
MLVDDVVPSFAPSHDKVSLGVGYGRLQLIKAIVKPDDDVVKRSRYAYLSASAMPRPCPARRSYSRKCGKLSTPGQRALANLTVYFLDGIG